MSVIIAIFAVISVRTIALLALAMAWATLISSRIQIEVTVASTQVISRELGSTINTSVTLVSIRASFARNTAWFAIYFIKVISVSTWHAITFIGSSI